MARQREEFDYHENTPLTATLVRGQVHFLKDIRFDKGCAVVIWGFHKDHLEEHAVERVGDADGELLVKDKFEYALYDGQAPVGTVVSGTAFVDEDRDYDAEARLRAFSNREAARREAEDSSEPAKFDKAETRSRIERQGSVEPGLPPARPVRVRSRPSV